LRMVPFVERNYNLVELGPRGTGKSHLFQQVSPYSHLISGGKATVAKMFVNNATGQRGLVCQYDVVCFDEVSGVSFDQKDGVNIMKGYMESGEFSRGKESIRADGSIVLVGNFDVDVEHQQRIGHLFGPLPRRCATTPPSWTAFTPTCPGWDVPKMQPNDAVHGSLRLGQRLSVRVLQPASDGEPAAAASGPGTLGRGAEWTRHQRHQQDRERPAEAAVSQPNRCRVSDEDLEWAVRLALEVRRRVKEQQKRIGSAEFRNTHFSYIAWRRGRREVRRDSGAVEREQHRRRPAGAGPGLDPESRWHGRALRSLSASRSTRGRGAV
jgi:ATP-dependent Lon protease